MKIKFFNFKENPKYWELNFIGNKYNFRIGSKQLAFWINYEPVFNFHSFNT